MPQNKVVDMVIAISLRGFDQRNTSFLINGQPVDMENGWVYWSNWQGLTDVTSDPNSKRFEDIKSSCPFCWRYYFHLYKKLKKQKVGQYK